MRRGGRRLARPAALPAVQRHTGALRTKAGRCDKFSESPSDG